MAKDPAVLFYTQDFITGTYLMTNEQRGKYIMLLCLQHQNDFLLEEDMLKICGSYDAVIWSKFEKENDKYINKRMKEEKEKRHKYCESRRQNRRGKNLKSFKTDNLNIKHMYQHMENENVNENENRNDNVIKSNNQENQPDFIDKIVNEFVDAYGDYQIVNRGKERAAAGKLLHIYKKQFPTASQDETLESLRIYFNSCIHIQDKWMRENMSLSLIINKFNEIKTILKNENGENTKPRGATIKQIAATVLRNFGNR